MKSDMDSGEQPEGAVTDTMFQVVGDALAEQKYPRFLLTM